MGYTPLEPPHDLDELRAENAAQKAEQARLDAEFAVLMAQGEDADPDAVVGFVVEQARLMAEAKGLMDRSREFLRWAQARHGEKN